MIDTAVTPHRWLSWLGTGLAALLLSGAGWALWADLHPPAPAGDLRWPGLLGALVASLGFAALRWRSTTAGALRVTATLGMAVAAGLAIWAVAALAAYRTEAVTWRSGDVTLAGTIYLPRGDGPFPAAVFVHGSGTQGQHNSLYWAHAKRLARRGIAMLIYDKRGVGASTGDWRQTGFTGLAADAAGGFALLRAHPAIDADRIGFFGVSQGGWVAPMAALETGHAAFMALLSPAPMTAAEQQLFLVRDALERGGAPPAAQDDALRLTAQVLDVYRHDAGWDEARAAVAAFAETHGHERWYDAGLLGIQAPDEWNWRWLREFMDVDGADLLRRLQMPVFVAEGDADRLVPGRASAETVERLARAPGSDFTVLLVPGAGHTLRARSGGPFAPEYWDALDAWLQTRVLDPVRH